MKNLNWSDILIPLVMSSSFGVIITILMRVLKLVKYRNQNFTWYLLATWLLEGFVCGLFGIFLGLLTSSFTDSITYICAIGGVGGMFGEKLYAKLQKKIEETDISDLVNTVNPVDIIDDVVLKEGGEILDSDSSQKTSEMRKPRIFALCVGINTVNPHMYNGNNGLLKGAENDAKGYGSYLEKRGHNVRYLLTEKATRDNIRQWLKEVSQFATEGDLVVFVYSGHGGQYQYRGKLFESYCLYDGQLPEREVRLSFSAFRKGVRTLAVLDCCHSGGFNKALVGGQNLGGDFRPKSMPKDMFIVDPLDAKGALAHDEKVIPLPNVKWYTACQKDELALDGNQNGLFTAANLKVLIDTEGVVTYADLHEKSQVMCKGYQKPELKTAKNTKFFDSLNVFEL
jgi:hypothetical protein